jgi:septation ring formation regulator EzrA
MFSNLKEVYKAGRSRGYQFGVFAVQEFNQENWDGVGGMFDPVEADAFEAEQNARQMPPFEFTAKALNEYDEHGQAWEQFEEGIHQGIKCALRCHK